MEITATAPARIFGMYPKKGTISVGSDADLVVWDPQAEHTISAKTHNMRCDYSMFEGFKVRGNAKQVYSRGELIVDNGKYLGKVGRGQYLRRGRARRRLAVIVPESSLYNADLAPTTPAHRTWGTYNYISLWFSMSMEVSTYMLASGLIAGGMDWKQAMGTILLGNLIVLIPLLLNAHAGAKYGIPFPVFVRAPFGTRGRECAGDSARDCGVRMVWHSVVDRRPGDSRHAVRDLAGRGGGAVVGVGVLSRLLGAEHGGGVARASRVDPLSAEILGSVHADHVVVAAVLRLHKAGGFGPMLSEPSHFQTTGSFLKFFFPSLTAMVGYWATLALNIPDFTRYAKDPARADRGAGVWIACCYDALFVHRDRGHVGVCSDLRAARSGARLS